jgi:hypothetical protein
MQFTPLFGALLPQTFRFNQLWKRYKTAKALDLELPPKLLALANEVIE